MDYFFGLLVIIYVVVVILMVRSFIEKDDLSYKLEVMEALKPQKRLIHQKNQLYQKKMELESEAIETFDLYEMTKEIVYSLSEEEAFKIFKSKLQEHISFQECRFISPTVEDIKKVKQDKEYFLFSLKGKKERMGYLIIKGVSPEDKDKVIILSQQFALALRRVKLYNQIGKIAITDSLTGVSTRRYLLERFEEELKRSISRTIKMSFVLLDVDYFKSYNDNYGHLTGDQILREIGSIIMENIREIDVVGRYGGEEFCVVLPETDREGAYYAAERIRVGVEKTLIKAYDTNFTVTISAGTSTFPEDSSDSAELIDKADGALYRAKKLGRNKVCSFPSAL